MRSEQGNPSGTVASGCGWSGSWGDVLALGRLCGSVAGAGAVGAGQRRAVNTREAWGMEDG
jgi:hypothetical protein